jgi:FkbM family methyltransferase
LAYALAQRVFLPLVEACQDFYTPTEDPLSLRFDLLFGNLEPETVRVVRQIVRPGMTVLDIGAHVGYYTKTFSKLVGSKGRVIAFEPHPLTFDILRWNARKLNNVTLSQIATFDREGVATLYDSQLDTSSSALRCDESKRSFHKALLSNREIPPRILQGLPTQSYAIKTRTVDSYLADRHINHVDFIKMDIEGAEMSALRGMKETIRSSRHLFTVMELNPRALRPFGVEGKDLFLELRKMGFSTIWVIDGDGGLHKVENDEMATHLVSGLMDSFARTNLLCEKRT